MKRRSSVEPVISAVVSALRSSTGVTGLAAGGVHNNVPQGTPYDYVEVTSPVDRRLDTYRRFGSEVLVNVKVVSQGRGDQNGVRILNECIRALGGEGGSNSLTFTSPHVSLGITWDNSERYAEVVNGVTTRYHVGMFRAWAEQTS